MSEIDNLKKINHDHDYDYFLFQNRDYDYFFISKSRLRLLLRLSIQKVIEKVIELFFSKNFSNCSLFKNDILIDCHVNFDKVSFD